MPEERGKDSSFEMSLSQKWSVRSVSVKSDHSNRGLPPNLSEKKTSSTKSVRSGSHVFSSVSMKSDHSNRGLPPNLSEKKWSTKSVRSGSHVFSSVSVKSDHSNRGLPPNLSEKKASSTKSVRSGSHVFSSVSMKSDHSNRGLPPNLSEKKWSTKSVRSGSHVFSSVSVKSDHSNRGLPPNLSEKKASSTKSVRSGSHVFSSVSMKSDHSNRGLPPNLSEKKRSTKRVQYKKLDTDIQTHRNYKNFSLQWIFKDLERKIITFMKNELKKFKKILRKEDLQYFVEDFDENRCSIKEAALDLTLCFLREMKQDEAADSLEDELIFIHQLKCSLKKKYQCVYEGIAKQEEELEEFELQKFKKSDKCLIRLLAVIKTSKRAR
ncbi:hypothetical protein QQF64_019741 [Cirrhinus molitorella]|uniref:Uncharacterized protein n=1 Tax=Cirrhinus molitorella TaxID=172907 RepID=A0ABR3LGE8_9TELE